MTGPLPGAPLPEPPPPGQAGIYRRFVLSGAGKAVSLVIQFAEQFLLVPVFLLLWGADRYGDWLALLSAAGFVAAIDLGVQAYFSNALQMAWARGERGAFQRMLNTGMGVYGVLIGIALPAVMLLGLLGPWPEWLNLRGPEAPRAASVITLLALYALANLPLGLANNIYRARGEYALGIMANNFRRTAVLVAIAAVLWSGAGVMAVVIAMLGVALACWVAITLHQRRRYAGLRYGLALPDREVRAEMASVCPFYAVVPVATALTVQGTVIAISSLTAAGALLVGFTTVRTLCSFARLVAGELGHVSGTELARQLAQGDSAALGRMIRFTGRLSGGLCGGLAGMIAVIGPPFLGFWTVGRIPFDGALFWPLLAAAAAAGPSTAGAKMLEFNNRPQGLAAAYGGAGVLTIALCLALIPTLGAAGAAWAVLAAEIGALGVVLPWSAARIAGVSPAAFIAATHGVAALCFAAGFGVAAGAVALTGDGSLGRLLAAGAIWAAVATLAAPWLLLTGNQRRGLFQRLRHRLPGR